MNNWTQILLLAVALIVVGILAWFFLKRFLNSVTAFLNRLPRWVYILIALVMVGAIVLIVKALVSSFVLPGGMDGRPVDGSTIEETTEGNEESKTGAEGVELPEHCILIRNNTIWIEGKEADLEAVSKYIDYRVEQNIPITIVEDYAMSELVHTVLDLCEEKGVKYKTENEKRQEY